MNRRTFYAAGPWDVVSGLLSAVISLTCFGLLLAAAWSGAYSAVYWLVKLVFTKVGLMLTVGVSTMLYRERITVDAWEQDIRVRRSWFIVPLGVKEYSYQQVRGLHWAHDGSHVLLKLDVASDSWTLAKVAHPDPVLEAEVSQLLGLEIGSQG